MDGWLLGETWNKSLQQQKLKKKYLNYNLHLTSARNVQFNLDLLTRQLFFFTFRETCRAGLYFTLLLICEFFFNLFKSFLLQIERLKFSLLRFFHNKIVYIFFIII